ncbi:MAG TPA: serine/threonine-protein kinase [Polyangiales bacterium]|nr:serine/threonine-protein kinase [Polyangiales bacterium]
MRTCPQCGGSYDDAIAFCPADGERTEAQVAQPSQDPLIGSVIDGRYRVEERIGEGGMGVVYRATHVVLRKPFALKVIRADQATDANIVQRFVREARAASGIGHPNIVNINDFGTTADGSLYLAMEFLDGMTLADAMKSGPIPFARALEIFIQIAGALEAAHAQGIVHRDLKPENIFLMREAGQYEFVKVLDFGIAKVKNAAAKLTSTGMVFGTPHYLSPEQAAGQPVDHRSDIYSLGVIMYQVLAGELPFTAESLMALMTKHMFEPAPSLREAGHPVPTALDAIVGRCLQKKPELRHGSMRELDSDLRRVQLSPVSEPRPPAALSALIVAASLGGSAPPAAFTATSETLDEAALSDVVSGEDDDEPIEVPMRRPVWLWAVAAGILVMLALSLSVRSREGQADDVVPVKDVIATPAARAPVADASPTAAEELPRGVSAPTTGADVPQGLSAPGAVAAPEGNPELPRGLAAPVPAAPIRAPPAAAPRVAAPAPTPASKPAARSKNKSGAQHGESLLDPWR